MRLRKRTGMPSAECDMTPMIDMTFQLIAFFMVLINFSEADQNERIHLPASELAKPAEAPFESPITLQLTKQGTVLFIGNEVTLREIKDYLRREKQVIKAKGGDAAKATVIIRADADAETGTVQELIKTCQEAGFEKFALRAKQTESQSAKAMEE